MKHFWQCFWLFEYLAVLVPSLMNNAYMHIDYLLRPWTSIVTSNCFLCWIRYVFAETFTYVWICVGRSLWMLEAHSGLTFICHYSYCYAYRCKQVHWIL